MTLKECVEAVIEYVEEHISDPLSADLISDKIGFSKFYLSRIFPIYTGMSLMAYVRKRKLNHALIDLQKDMRIIDIAVFYGYSSERAFSRAFVNEFGQSPSHYRKNKYVMKGSQRVFDIQLPRKDWIDMIKDYLSDISYEVLDEMTVISGVKSGFEPEDEIINEMMTFKTKNSIDVKRMFGFDSPIEDERAKLGERGYELWLVVDQEIDLSETSYSHKSIPAYKYAKLRITDPFSNPMERIPKAWRSIITWIEDNKVLKKSDYDETLNCLEEVIEVDGITYMDIMVPIEKI